MALLSGLSNLWQLVVGAEFGPDCSVPMRLEELQATCTLKTRTGLGCSLSPLGSTYY